MEEKRVKKPWGGYVVFEKTDAYWVKKLVVKKGARLSLQSHEDRYEMWVVLSGRITATREKEEQELGPGETVRIGRGERHRIEGVEDSVVLEAAFGRLSEEDITRYQDDYGRAE